MRFEKMFEIGDVVVVTDSSKNYPCYLEMEKILGVSRDKVKRPKQGSEYVVVNFTLHPDSKTFVYALRSVLTGDECLMGENAFGLASQDEPKETPKYKPRAKWVKNTGQKPDLPDGTVVKCHWDDGDTLEGFVEDAAWYISKGNNIVKWKLADDWNVVVDGQAPDIAKDTLIDVEWEDGLRDKNSHAIDFQDVWEFIKKWRYAKVKK